LIYKAAKKPEYRALVNDALRHAAAHASGTDGSARAFLDKLFVNFGCELLKIVPGRVSTETDARFSFDSAAIIEQAERLIELYERAGVERQRVLIKVSSTWEGIRAAEQLERRSIHCNLTLMFSFAQAVACADAGLTLVSPFVGRISDWHKKQRGTDDIPTEDDPGVAFVSAVFDYYRHHGYQTEVMGASFRKVDQILALAGCDLLTCSPELLAELARRPGSVSPRLAAGSPKTAVPDRLHLDEKEFRWMFNQDPMAVEKLAEGIRIFHADARQLEEFAGFSGETG
jgi:transaldolase